MTSLSKRSGRPGLALLFATTALLAACGGGGDAAAPPPADPLAAVPDDARASVAGLVGYLDSLSKSSSDSRDPVDLTAVASLPSNEDGEPTPL